MRPDATTPRRTIRSERARILMNAQHQLDRLSESALPFDLRIDAMFDVLLQAGRDLDRVARREALSVAGGMVSA